jgi:hypothetical protein
VKWTLLWNLKKDPGNRSNREREKSNKGGQNKDEREEN